MPLLGLIGFPLAHSFSPGYFKQKFKAENVLDWDYQLFPIETIEELPQLIENHPQLLAFNVTIPHKETVLQYCQEFSQEVTEIGAANFIVIDRKRQTLTAYNTDYWGFYNSLLPWYTGHKKALVLGSGGSSKAIQLALKNLNIDFDLNSRSRAIDFKLSPLNQYSLIVNCTPLGMHSAIKSYPDLYPLPYEQIDKSHFFYDLVYNPELSPMILEFSKHQAQIKNGLEMLHLQADKAWEIVKALAQK